jgi:uncharacterized protein (DUF58 family)
VREYRSGDPLRHVDWRATARTGAPLVREFEPSASPRVAVFLDTRLPTFASIEASRDVLEFTIALAASIVADLAGRGMASATADVARPSRSGRGPETIRDAYRRVLTTARASGNPRAVTETTGELRHRLTDGLAAPAAGALAQLTALYDAARYGGLDGDETTRRQATAQADTVNSAIGQQPAHGNGGS